MHETSTNPTVAVLYTYDLVAHLADQIEFSALTFGPGRRTEGVIDHITREFDEIREHPEDVEEWVDVILLALDGAWRSGHSPEQVAGMLAHKLARNKTRTWPDWRTLPQDRAIEHDRTADTTPTPDHP